MNQGVVIEPVAGQARPSLFERALDRIPFLEKELLVLRQLVGPGGVCIDVGAAGGAHLWALSRLVGPGGAVHGFEPRPASHRILAVQRRLLRRRNVRVHRLALGAEHGEVAMRVPRWTRTMAYVRTDDDGDASPLADREIRVPVTTLDAFVAAQGLRRVDLVKCDVEGHELDVLAGATRTIDRWHPVLVCEVERQHLARYGRHPDDLQRWLAARGYRPHRYANGRLAEVDALTAIDNDFVFLPPAATDRSAAYGAVR